MTLARCGAAAIVLAAVLGVAGCGNSGSSTAHGPASGAPVAEQPNELGDVQSTLDSIDGEMAGDDSQ